MLKSLQVKVSETPAKNLRSQLTRVKDPPPAQRLSNGIYSISCGCRKYYIGQTKRFLSVRLKEHKNNIRKNKANSVTDHSLICDHQFLFDNARFIDFEKNWKIRLFKESIAIKHFRHKNNLIDQEDGIPIDNSWQSIINGAIEYKH